MADNHPSLLVVDDEEVVCQACRRIFCRQGFQVEVNTDARQGLAWAMEKEYQMILLDIKMPNMDGIEFLEHLRDKKPNIPVLIITGYPSIPNAASAMRLGACDYVTKPFTSEEITQAVHRVLATRALPGDWETPPTNGDTALSRALGETLFWDQSWFRLEADGSASVGAVISGLCGTTVSEVRLPRIGEVVYQGLPLAGVVTGSKHLLVVPSPVSGVIVVVNEKLPRCPDLLVSDPCREGWIACICTTQYDDEADSCRCRRVLLVDSAAASTAEHSQRLQALGCRVEALPDRDALMAALGDYEDHVVFLDAASFDAAGPGLVSLMNDRAPRARIVVMAPPDCLWETAYRKQKIFYYAVTPFSDGEMVDILTAAFRPQESQPTERHKEPSEPISVISITNRNGHKIQLLAAPGLLWRNEGLGRQLGERLLERMFPVTITPGIANLAPANILKTAAANDRIMVLLARDSGLLPGCLARDTKPDFGFDPGDAAGKVTTVAVQPDVMGGLAGLDTRTTAALADHIVREMALY